MRRPGAIIDTGPIVAFLTRDGAHGEWATQQFKAWPAPFLTCESVLSEAFFLLRRHGQDGRPLFDLLATGALAIGFQLTSEWASVSKLAAKYANRPISLADACLVRMSEMYPDAPILTMDSDFTVYRRNGRQAIPVNMPL